MFITDTCYTEHTV